MNTKSMTATRIVTQDRKITMYYHNTAVAQWDTEQEDVILFTNGYFTNTTKKRMNQFSDMFNLGYRVFQDKGEWFVTDFTITLPFDDKGWATLKV